MPKTLDIDILSTGVNVDAFGNVIETDENKLKEIAESYDPDLFKGKIVLGHSTDAAFMSGRIPSDKIPSYGTIERAYYDDESKKLRGVIEVADDAVDWIANKHFTDRSVALYSPFSPYSPTKGKYYIRHLALLGASPPAIKGLQPLDEILAESYSENTDLGIETITMITDKTKISEANTEPIEDELNSEVPPEFKKEEMEANMEPEEVETVVAEDVPVEPEPEPEANAEEENEIQADPVEFLNENASIFLTEILTDGNEGYQGEISRFDPEPTQENNWLTDENGNFSGVFVDESLGEPESFEFSLIRNGETWTQSFKPVNGEDMLQDAAVDEVVEEEVMEEKEANGQKPVALTEDGDKESEVEEMVEEEVEEEMKNEANGQMANSDARVSEPVVEANCDCDYEAESVMALDPRDKEIAMLKKMLMEKAEAELFRQGEELYSEGILIEGQIPQAELKKVLTTLQGVNTTVAAFGEEYESPATMLIGMLSKLPKQIAFGESLVTQDKEVEFRLPITEPVGVAFSEEGTEQLKKIVAYCEKNNLNLKDINYYRKAMRATA